MLIPNNYGKIWTGLNWLKSIMLQIVKQKQVGLKEFNSGVLLKIEECLIKALSSTDTEQSTEIRLFVGKVWKLYVTKISKILTFTSYPSICSKILTRMDDITETVRSEYFHLLCSLDCYDTLISLDKIELDDCLVEKFKAGVLLSPVSMFGNQEFQFVMLFLGLAPFLPSATDLLLNQAKLGEKVENWALRMFYSCKGGQSLKLDNNDILLAGLISVDSLMYWVLWETARYLINGKLRTPMGAPFQSLESIEKTLESYLNIMSTSKLNNEFVELRNLACLERLKYLLMFLDILEVQISIGGTGCFQSVPLPPKSSMLFLHTNIKVCNDWFSRIRSRRLEAANLIDNFGISLRLSSQQLINSKKDENNDMILPFYSSLMKINDYDALEGLSLHAEAKLKTGHGTSSFLMLSSKMASGELELASDFFLRKLEEVDNPYIAEIQNNTLECLMNLQEWKTAAKVLKRCTLISKVNYEDYVVLLSFWTDDHLINSTKRLDMSVLLDYGITKSLCSSFIHQLLESSQHPVDFDSICNMAAPISFLLNDNDVQNRLKHCILAQGIVFSNPQLVKEDNELSGRYFNFSATLLPLWTRLLSIHAKRSPINSKLDHLRSLVCSVAREAGNLNLSEKLLSRHSNHHSNLKYAIENAKLVMKYDSCRASLGLLEVLRNSNESDVNVIAEAYNLLASWSNSSLRENNNYREGMNSFLFGRHESEPYSDYVEIVSSRLLRKSLDCSPTLPNTWFLWGNFCFHFASKIIRDIEHNRYNSEHLASLKSLKIEDRQFEHIIDAFLSRFSESNADNDLPTHCSDAEIETVHFERINSLLNSIYHETVGHFEKAAKSYFRYLELCEGAPVFDQVTTGQTSRP